MGLKFEGVREFRGAFERLRQQSRDKLSEACREYLEGTVLPLTKELVPKLSGDLEETARVVPGERIGSWQIRYGNSPIEDKSQVDYAAAVHEIESAHHDPPTSAKFVSLPLENTKELLAERAAKKLDELAREG